MNRRAFLGISTSALGLGGYAFLSRRGDRIDPAPPPEDLDAATCPDLETLDHPALSNNGDWTVCASDRSAETGVGWRVTKQVLPVERATTTFTLENRTERWIESGPAAWNVAVRTDEGWQYLAPESAEQPAVRIDPGESYTWTLVIGSTVNAPEIAEADEPAKVHAPGRGLYLFSVPVTADGNETAYAALLKLA